MDIEGKENILPCAFVGQHKGSKMPNGFARVINEHGIITEGIFKENGQRNGWCMSFNGYSKSLYFGWYVND